MRAARFLTGSSSSTTSTVSVPPRALSPEASSCGAGCQSTSFSEPGEGTTFKIYLPRSEKEVDWHPAPQDEASGERALGGTETVLVVEDEEPVLSLAARILSGRGYQILTAGSGKEALEVVNEYSAKIDLLLTDVVLPGMI